MTTNLHGKTIALGVSGSIACYKAVEIASYLTQAGAKVDVILTAAAREFLSPITFQSITHRPVVTDLFSPQSEIAIDHVAIARRADLILIAPATANTLARLSLGLADDALGCTVLGTAAPVVAAPAMDANMYQHPATQEHVARLRARGWTIVDPAWGHLASGAVGQGRLAPLEEIVGTVRLVLGRSGPLAGRHVVVSAGGTQEPIDPVRYITNRSSGKMGYAIAEAARDRGARVTLVSAPVGLSAPVGVDLVPVRTAAEMAEAVKRVSESADVLIMAAAVADYRVAMPAAQKIKKTAGDLTLTLVRNPDILSEVKGTFVKVGFAAESEHLREHALDKLQRKGLDLIVANDITAEDAGFGSDYNRVLLIDRAGREQDLPRLPKTEVAGAILDAVQQLLGPARRT